MSTSAPISLFSDSIVRNDQSCVKARALYPKIESGGDISARSIESCEARLLDRWEKVTR